MLLKICGLTRYEDIVFCDKLGVNFVGFIFYNKSPRYIDSDFIKRIKTQKALKVGVFVNHPIDEILAISTSTKLDFIQLHGNYTLSDCKKLGKDRVIKVLWPDSYTNVEDFLKDMKLYSEVCKYILLDAGKKGGGHGKTISNYGYLQKIPQDIKWLLAGGISPENISIFLQNLTPCGIDVNSGVEISPGVKDKEKINAILKKIKEIK